VHSVVLDPSATPAIYAGTPSGVMKSLDAGVTWTAMTNGFSGSTNITALVIDPVNPQNLYATTTINFAPYRTTDGGAHWSRANGPRTPACSHTCFRSSSIRWSSPLACRFWM
jgi:photosystem II stability/assembly factor-like uncharacterized protein